MKNFFQSVLKHIDKLDATKLREQYRLVTEEVAFFEMVFNAMTEGAVLYNLEGEIVACKITDADRTCCQVELPETLPPYSFVIVTTKSRK
jgi:hypothetical protein